VHLVGYLQRKNQFHTAVNIKIAVLSANYCEVYCGVVNSAMEIAAESLIWKLLPFYKSTLGHIPKQIINS
jgi:hypothetical protein